MMPPIDTISSESFHEMSLGSKHHSEMVDGVRSIKQTTDVVSSRLMRSESLGTSFQRKNTMIADGIKKSKKGTKLYFKKQQSDSMAAYFYALGFSLIHFVLFGVMFTFQWTDIEQAKAFDLEIRSEVERQLIDKPELRDKVDL